MKRKVRFYFLNILLFIVILMLALVLFVWFFCGVRKRTYEGCQVYTEDQLTGLLFKEKYDKNTITCSVMSILRPKKGIPFIESVSVRPASLTEVHVTVKEKERYGVCDTGDGKYVYFDSAFKVVEISDVLLPGSFLVSLPPFEKAPAVGEVLPAGSVQKKILQTVKKETADRDCRNPSGQPAEPEGKDHAPALHPAAAQRHDRNTTFRGLDGRKYRYCV